MSPTRHALLVPLAIMIVVPLLAGAARAADTILYREDFNRHAPGARLVKDVGWQRSGNEIDDVSLATGGRDGEKDLFLDGSTNVPMEQGASGIPYFSKEFDRFPDPVAGRYVVLEIDLRAGPGGAAEETTSNCEFQLVDRNGGYPGIIGRWVRTLVTTDKVKRQPVWTFASGSDIAIAEKPSDTFPAPEQARQWVHAAIVMDGHGHTVQASLQTSAGTLYSRVFRTQPTYSMAYIRLMVIRQDTRNHKFALDVDNILVRQTDTNPIPAAKRTPIVGEDPDAVPPGPDVAAPVVEAREGEQFPKWLEPSDEVVSDHIKWAKPSASGPLRVLFIVRRGTRREVVEICQRFDVDREVFAISARDAFGNRNKRAQALFPGIGPKESAARLRDQLAKDYDCIVLGHVPWTSLPTWGRNAILDKVRAGTGLLARIPLGAGGIDKMLAARLDVPAADVLGAFPAEALPAFRTWPDLDTFFDHHTLLAQLGEGRIAQLVNIRSSDSQMTFLTPEIVDPFPAFSPVHYDYYLAMVGRLLEWCAGRDADVRVVPPSVASARIDRKDLDTLAFSVRSARARDLEAECVLRTDDWGNVVARQKKTVTIAAGMNRIAFDLDPVPAGRYFADLRLRDNAKVVTFGSVHVTVTSDRAIGRLALSRPSFPVGATIRGQVTVSGKRDGLTVELSQRDAHGRVVMRRAVTLKGDADQSALSFDWLPPRPLTAIQHIDARLLDGDDLLDVATATFLYNNLRPDRRDVRWVIYQGNHGASYLDLTVARELRRAGFDSVGANGGWTVRPYPVLMGTPYQKAARQLFSIDEKRTLAASILLNDLFFLPSIYRALGFEYDGIVEPRGYQLRETAAGLARVPCITNPGYIERCRRVYQAGARKWRDFSIPEYNLGDECALVNHNREHKDVCFSSTCIRDFQHYLRSEYETIDALNAEYGTAHKRFDDVIPIPFDRVADRSQIPLWIDHRRHMENVWASYFDNARRFIREIDPGAKVGYEGSDEPGHVYTDKVGGGENYYKLARAMDMNATYYYPVQLDCVRDWSPPGSHIGGGWYGGYPALWRAGKDPLHHRWWLWNTLLRGANAFWVYEGTGFPHYDGMSAVIAPDLSFYDFFNADIDEMRIIKGGIGKLILSADRPDDAIAVLYSTPSMFLTTFTDGLPKRWDSISAAPFLLTEAGFQYRMLAAEELDSGLLTADRFRALYLPYCQAISPEGVAEILRFAKDGGTVIADLRPAVADDHGRPYPAGALDDLFGIKQTTTVAKPATASAAFKEPFGKLTGALPEARLDASLQLAGASALADAGGAPAVVVNDFGKGKAVLFNLALGDWMAGNLVYAPHFADNAKAEAARDLMRAALARGAVTPEVTLTPDVPGCHVWRHRAGDALIVGLLWDAPAFLPGINYGDANKVASFAANEERPVTLTLPSRSHVYDVLAGEYIAHARQLERTVRPGRIHLLAAMPRKIDALALSLARDRVQPGEEVSFSASIDSPGAHTVLRLALLDPDGNPVPHYAANIAAPNGKADASFSLALSDTPGEWTLRLRDCLTGAQAQRPLTVLPADQ